MVGLAYPAEGERRTQVLLTTHSPDLVDLFSDMPEAVHVVDHDASPNGHYISRVKSLPEILEKLNQTGRVESIGQAWATGLYEKLFANQVDANKPILLGPRDCWSPGDSGAERPLSMQER